MIVATTGSVKLHLGCGNTVLDGWMNVDSCAYPGVTVVDLEDCVPGRIPLSDNSVSELLASHVLEHIRAPMQLMEELYRVAQPDAKFVIQVPYGSSDDAYEDPTHVRPYFLGSFGYFSQPYFWRVAKPYFDYKGDWYVESIDLIMSDTPLRDAPLDEIARAVKTIRNVVAEMVVTLRAQKPARKPLHELRENYSLRYLFRPAATL